MKIDDRDFQKKLEDFTNHRIPDKRKQAVHDVATEILRLSSFEIPHDKGTLQNSGNVEDEDERSVVGYNTVYAARLHEHPEYRFQKNRKGKYLEDPIKNNMAIFLDFFKKRLSEAF